MVTGANGFIGSHFVEQLALRNANVISIHRNGDARRRTSANSRPLRIDLLDQGELLAACKYVAPRIDAIVHCAALDGNTEFKTKHSAEILDANLRIASNILNCARRTSVDDVVMISSAEVYTAKSSGPVNEDEDYREHMEYSTNGYRLSKIFTEILADLHRSQFGMRVFLPRPTNVYGPRDSFGGTISRVIPNMITRIVSGEEVEIWGTGRQTRTFVHVEDLVSATLRMVETNKHQTLNIGAPEPVSMVELAEMLFAILDRPVRVRLDLDKPTGSSSRLLDLTRFDEIVDFTPRSLRDGLEQTVSWYLDNRSGGGTEQPVAAANAPSR
ncbi:dTDP-4-dehydro-6-deoxy-alpha-D-gulose 4-ketoreductase [Herbihabitans rhizosphaerae]|uniref:dTDP-4-dehydro-6-deoxy-alpha-D-gulose 4-ketoreductase n=1 Tax=Herbihabitans rhizosphaerae TaxID=1872711 RepID=A0A4Q7KIG6_9PSEU|nr:NAD(P)-dependent oxidoreductase [Herbihabitans rhizosphaerae]RZS36329.1 dTDP-4-dehydro-6-deoxy-alpha-D-gulose 4-ketoreductase [Herbihabitans rhizosphaerae]